ncbi:MAG: yqjA [Microbacteriaceae bacterium]|nr:yqjA [Microbacteriaceae bacterium]
MVQLAALDGQASGWLATFGPVIFYLIVWALVFSGTGLFIGIFIPFITGDSLLFAAGLVSARTENVNIWVLALGVGIAAFLGDQVGFLLGRHFGRPYLDKRTGGWVKNAVRRSEKFYSDLGWWAVVVARFIPWGRVFVPPIAGIARMDYVKFLTANVVGALVWGVLLTVTGYFAASIPAVKSAAYLIGGAFILASIVAGVISWRRKRSAV